MRMTGEEELKIEGRVDTCPACGYTDGFHISFDKVGSTAKIILICPQCQARYDPDWAVRL